MNRFRVSARTERCRLSCFQYGLAILCSGLSIAAAALAQQPRELAGLPLQPTRSIRFTTNEGTWMSLDVSPNGKTIIFDLLGDLYTLSISGGKATRISSGLAFDAQPRFSPDGKKIVFTSDRDGWVNVWIANSDGTAPHQITHKHWPGALTDPVYSPVFTPDGQSVVVSEMLNVNYGIGLSEYPIAGGPPIPLTHVAFTDDKSEDEKDQRMYLGPTFGQDPNLVYAAVRSGSKSGWVSYNHWQIAKVDRRSRISTLVTTPFSGFTAMRPALSRNGRYLVFASPSGDGTGLRLHDLVTDHETWLTQRGLSSVAAWLSRDSRDLVPGSAFTPDSRSLVVSLDGKIVRIDVATGMITPIPFVADVDVPLGPLVKFEYPITDNPFIARAIRNPQISPDGRQVVFSALDRLWILDLPQPIISATGTLVARDDINPKGLAARRLTKSDEGEFFPAWSPDGREIAYCTWSDNAGGAIQRTRADGTGDPVRLTYDGAWYGKTTYAPDGQRVIAVRGWPDAFRVSARAGMQGGMQIISVLAKGGGLVAAVSDMAQAQHEDGDRGNEREGKLSSRTAVADVSSSYLRNPGDRGNFGKRQALVYSQPHIAGQEGRLFFYDPDQGVVSMCLDGTERRVVIREIAFQKTGMHPELIGPTKPIEVLLSPSGDYALALAPMTSQPYLITLPSTPSASPPTISLTYSGNTSNGVWRLSQSGADFLGWTPDGRPYYSAGNALFIADRSLQSGAVAPTFHQITINVQIKRDHGSGSLLLRNARILTMAADAQGQTLRKMEQNGATSGGIVERGDVLVRDGRIAAVGPTGMIVVTDAKVIDLTGKTILPGYVDIHDHVGQSVSFGVHTSQEPRLMVDLAYGVTTLRDPLGYGIDLMALGERAAAGDLIAPRIYTVNTGISSTLFDVDGHAQDLEQTREVLRLWSDYWHSETVKQYLAGGRRTRQLIIMAARELGLMPTNEGPYNTSMDLTFAMDGYPAFEHSLPTNPIYNDVVQLFVQSGTIQDPTLGTTLGFSFFLRHYWPYSDAKLERFLPPVWIAGKQKDAVGSEGIPDNETTIREASAQAVKVMAAGGCVSVGSHGDIPGLGAHWEMWTMTMGGMPAYDALRAGTICSAKAIGHERDFGSIEVGKLADLQVLDKNPLEDIHNTTAIRYVMKDGRLYEANTLNEVWPRQRSLQRQWWQE